MRTIGHWSIASVINFVISFFAFGAGLAIIFSVLLLTAAPFVRVPITVTVPVSFTMDMPDQVISSRPNWGFEFRETRRPPAPQRALDRRVEGSVRLPADNRWFIFANGLALIVALIYVFLVLIKLRGVLRTLIFDKKPFVAANAARIRFIGFAIIAAELVRFMTVSLENAYARSHIVIPGVVFDMLPPFSMRAIFMGLIIVIIAEVFRAGTELDEDQSLTI